VAGLAKGAAMLVHPMNFVRNNCVCGCVCADCGLFTGVGGSPGVLLDQVSKHEGDEVLGGPGVTVNNVCERCHVTDIAENRVALGVVRCIDHWVRRQLMAFWALDCER